jgi:aspartate/methionine/tyrosine aminotransferase
MKSQDTIIICPSVISQVAAVAALDVGRAYADGYVRQLAGVRRLVIDALADLHPICDVPSAEGAFYCLLRVNRPIDSMTLSERLIREHRVAVIPGSAFGMTDGCYLRVAYGALQEETVAEGIGRLVSGLRAILQE